MKEVIIKYQTFIKYIIVAGLSFVLDITLFTLFNYLISKIIIATICARIISSFVNYLLNRNKVFKNTTNKKKTLIEYYLLVVVQMLVSGCTVDLLYYYIKINPTLIKIPVEIILFLCNYFIQKKIIFRCDKNGKNKN